MTGLLLLAKIAVVLVATSCAVAVVYVAVWVARVLYRWFEEHR